MLPRLLVGIAITALFLFLSCLIGIGANTVLKERKKSVNIDTPAKKMSAEQTAQDAILPTLKDAGVTTDNLYMNNHGQFIVCVPRDEITEWLDKNRNASIESLTPLNSAGGQTEKIIVIYQLNK